MNVDSSIDEKVAYLTSRNPIKWMARRFAGWCGYICVPRRYPEWARKNATHCKALEFIYKIEPLSNASWALGRGQVYKEIAQEIEAFGRQ